MLKYYQRRDTLTQKLHSRLKDRATKTTLEQRNIVPFGYFQDAVCFLLHKDHNMQYMI